jgi:hypothetical protein
MPLKKSASKQAVSENIARWSRPGTRRSRLCRDPGQPTEGPGGPQAQEVAKRMERTKTKTTRSTPTNPA